MLPPHKWKSPSVKQWSFMYNVLSLPWMDKMKLHFKIASTQALLSTSIPTSRLEDLYEELPFVPIFRLQKRLSFRASWVVEPTESGKVKDRPDFV